MARPNLKAKLGEGGRFAALKNQIASEKGISGSEAGAIAANAGRKAHGSAQMAKWSKAGK